MDRDFTLTVLEDLGGGLAAFGSTKMEQGSDFRGAQLQFADTNLGLRSSALGEFKFSNTRTSDTFAAIVSPAINLRDGLYDDNGITSRGAIDVVAYTSPELIPGLKASIAYIDLGDGDITAANQAVTAAKGRPSGTSAYILGASYVAGPLTAMVTYKGKPKNMIAGTAAATSQIGKANIEAAALYNAGFAVIGLGYDGASTEGATALATDGTVVQTDKAATGFSVTVPVGAISLGMEYWKRAASTETRFGATYALSKRTSLTAGYGTKDFPKLANPSTITADSQYRLAVKHTF